MTRAKVIQLGLIVFILGAMGYWAFRLFGFDGLSAGIAAEAILIVIVFGWTGSYLLRVITGKMTFMEQRKRYRKVYEELTTNQLQARFDSLSDEEQRELIEHLEGKKKASSPPSEG